MDDLATDIHLLNLYVGYTVAGIGVLGLMGLVFRLSVVVWVWCAVRRIK